MGRGGWSPSSPSLPRAPDLQWLPLQDHPVFKTIGTSSGAAAPASLGNGNLAAWDAASSRLYLWDPVARHIHRISVRFSDDLVDEGEASPARTSPLILGATPSEVLAADAPVISDVGQISLNADGSSLLLSGRKCLLFMNLRERASPLAAAACSPGGRSTIITYRTSDVGSEIFATHSNGLEIIHMSWHPYSSSHVGILSSDSVLRLFDLSFDLERPEQEFYLQPFESGSCQGAVSTSPVAFSFGGQHLWDRFSIFVLFSDGSTYVLCPVTPFGSVCGQAFLEELYEDANMFRLKSSNVNSNLALEWLESTFPELADESLEDNNKLVLRAHPYAPLDASLTLQGPLRKLINAEESYYSKNPSAHCEGKAVTFLYSSIGKDSVLVTGWSSGQLQIDALADEVQPLWNIGTPRLRIDSYGRIKGVAMICDPNLLEPSANPINLSLNICDAADTVWMGPPLLRLATVDLALPSYALDNCVPALFLDPLLADRFYCVHGAGIDLISLHFLPFSNLLDGTNKIEKAPSVVPLLTCAEPYSQSALRGFVALADTCGHSELVAISPENECIILESKIWTETTPLHCSLEIQSAGSIDSGEAPGVISKEILDGPKPIVLSSLPNLRSLKADSIDGRSALHQYIKLFHENYVEYAHKVFVELEHHENYLKMTVGNQYKRLHDLKQSLLSSEVKQQGIQDRINRALKVYELLEQRLQNFRMLPGAKKKPLSRAERELKGQLETFADVELDALRSSVDALSARVRRIFQSSVALNSKGQSPVRGKNQVSDSQMQKIMSSMEILSVINHENSKKVNLIEQGLKRQEEDL